MFRSRLAPQSRLSLSLSLSLFLFESLEHTVNSHLALRALQIGVYGIRTKSRPPKHGRLGWEGGAGLVGMARPPAHGGPALGGPSLHS